MPDLKDLTIIAGVRNKNLVNILLGK